MKFEDLKFVRLTIPSQFALIPRALFEQVKGGEFKIDRLYQFGPMLLASPLTFFYALADKETALIKGVLWAEVNPFCEDIYAHIFSIDKKYQNNGDAMGGAIEKLREIRTKEKLSGKITSETTRLKAVERAGWRISKRINVEI
ncbi:unnamed protein product [marine sediment metagenome]|uniref:N-acetyltransferase domain-containing protein n=1 Tax=marine sediment metagenome TaxID=412755 RepID=X1K8Z7_9ZZZZ